MQSERLHALDTRTGADVATWGSARGDLAFVMDDDRAPALIELEAEQRLIVLDPSGEATPAQRATITGKRVCDDCAHKAKLLANFKVRFGDAETTTSASGAFSVVVTDRGSLWLDATLPDGLEWAPPFETRVTIGTKPVFKLGTHARKLVNDDKRRCSMRRVVGRLRVRGAGLPLGCVCACLGMTACA